MEQIVQGNFEQVKAVDPAPPVQEPDTKAAAARPDDLVKRVSEFKLDPEKPVDPDDDFSFDVTAIRNAKTVEDAAKWAQDAYKSFQRGFNEKYQDISHERKALDELRGQYEKTISSASSQWTPERLQRELQDPEFIKVVQSLQTDEFSNLSESEKQHMLQMKQEQESLKKEQRLIARQQQEFANKQQDNKLSEKYNNYNPDIVDRTINDMNSGNYDISKLREDIFKVVDYDSAITRAYNLGKQDGSLARKTEINDKLTAASLDNTTVSEGYAPPEIPATANSRTAFVKLALARLAQFSKDAQKQN